MSSSRRQVLSVFKALHRTAQTVFRGDPRALTVVRQRIIEDFRSNKDVAKQESIDELIGHAWDCNKVGGGVQKSIVVVGTVPDSICAYLLLPVRGVNKHAAL